MKEDQNTRPTLFTVPHQSDTGDTLHTKRIACGDDVEI